MGEESLRILHASVGKKTEIEFPDTREAEELAAMKVAYPRSLQEKKSSASYFPEVALSAKGIL